MRPMRPMRLGVWLAVAVVLAVAVPSPAADEFVVVVHPSVAGTNVHRGDLAAVFLRKATRWGTGVPALPVDQSGTSPVRSAFSESVLGMSVATAVQYWQKQMFSTNPLRPPAVKGSDAEVIAFVEKTAGAVGYVSKAAALPAGVKAIAVID
jgi:ABC-type phosphate transport system substrate-binding protein